VSVVPGQPGHGTATITEWNLAKNVQADNAVPLIVDFDPHTLELTYTVAHLDPGQQAQAPGARTSRPPRSQAPAQWTGGSTTLALTLVFDSTTTGTSVQQKTDRLVSLTKPPSTAPGSDSTPPARVVQFSWGSFTFYGSVASMSQTIDYFSAGGVPLRATVSLSLVMVDPPASSPTASSSAAPATSFGSGVGVAGGAPAAAAAGASAAAGISASVGITPLTLSAAGDTVQGIAAQAGTSVSWKVVAAANNIDNPRILPPGTVLDLSAGASASAGAGAQVQTS
jgi:hypothetical protein